ncbi:Phosphorelay intermediate protein [Maublancomyces gigas]|uniref:Phosphorelay intermediate protein n=1 Tax=Discina gigas TaxID=1032678 RepID=A0ABR3GXQ8_9PEZI
MPPPTVETAPKERAADVEERDHVEDLTTIPEDVVDRSTFDQILEMDDDEEREFSRAIVFGFFDQAEETFRQMEESVKARDLPQLSSLGHFLKGSSATLGLTKVKDSCEKIQHLGVKKDENGTHDITDESLCLDKIKKTLDTMKKDYRQAEVHLTKFYSEEIDSPP